MRHPGAFVVAISLLVSLHGAALAQHEVALRFWTEVKGTTKGDEMGSTVTAIPPNRNLPFRAAVARAGRTYFYGLADSLDTSERYTIRGEHLMVGDINGDSLLDAVVVNTIALSPNMGLDTVFIYLGLSSGGLDTLHPIVIPGEGYGEGPLPGCVADVNNDGKMDLILRDPGSAGTRGKLLFYFGPVTTSTPDQILLGDSAYYYLGLGGVAVADVNGDGLNDLVVRGGFGRLLDSNYIRVYWGARGSLPLSDKVEIHGTATNYLSMACFDVNGDGVADVLYNDKDTTDGYQHVYVLLGGTNFPQTRLIKLKNPGDVADYGNTIINAGDMNGDGYTDIAVGAFRADPADGLVFIYCGGPQIDGAYDGAIGLGVGADFGWSIALLGDVNGDGLSDLIVGGPQWYFGDARGYWSVVLGDRRMTVTSVNGNPRVSEHSEGFTLFSNYPNPFNPQTTIRYRLTEQAQVTVEVFNLLGERVALLVDHTLQERGDHEVKFQAGSSLGSGIYYSRLSCTTGDGQIHRQARAMTLVK